ncbi:MAG: hypothetical protein WC607_04965 [Candidatus Micrarchaeia archaeon]
MDELHRVPGWSYNRHYLSEVLGRLVEKKRVERVKRGVFKVFEPSALNEFKVGLGLVNGVGAYIGFGSALRLHGLIDEELSTVFVASNKARLTRVANYGDYKVVALGGACVGSIELRGVRVSSKAKTVFDCFLRPNCCGGLNKLIEVAGRLELSDSEWRELLGYCRAFASNALKQRVGFVFERYGNRPPRFFLKGLLKELRESRSIAFLNPHEKKGSFDPKWRVVVSEGAPEGWKR